MGWVRRKKMRETRRETRWHKHDERNGTNTTYRNNRRKRVSKRGGETEPSFYRFQRFYRRPFQTPCHFPRWRTKARFWVNREWRSRHLPTGRNRPQRTRLKTMLEKAKTVNQCAFTSVHSQNRTNRMEHHVPHCPPLPPNFPPHSRCPRL